jgi:hypothetical protein
MECLWHALWLGNDSQPTRRGAAPTTRRPNSLPERQHDGLDCARASRGSNDLPQLLGQRCAFGHRPAVRCGIEDLTRRLERATTEHDRKPRHRRIRRHRIELPG